MMMWKTIFFFVLFCVAVTSAPSLASEKAIAVIVNPANATNNLTANTLARIYRGEIRNWPDGQKILAINRPVNSAIRAKFYHKILHVKPTHKFFQPGSPIAFRTTLMKSDLVVRKFVARLPNAIGYVRASRMNSSLKVVTIDGLQPNDGNYLLSYWNDGNTFDREITWQFVQIFRLN